MKKRNNDEENENQKQSKIAKKTETEVSINNLPTVLIKYLSEYLDLRSLMRFTSTSRKFNKINSEMRRGIYYLYRINFKPKLKNSCSNFLCEEIINQNNNFFCLDDHKKEFSIQEIILQKKFFELKNDQKESPIQCIFARNFISFEMVKYFVENKADLNEKHKKKNSTTLHLASNNSEVTPEILRFLIENKSDPKLVDSELNTPLHYACKNWNISTERLDVLIRETNLGIFNQKNFSPFHCACKNSFINLGMIKFLVEKKCDIFLQNNKGNTPFHLICQNKKVSVDILQFFINQKVDVNHDDLSGNTPFHFYCLNSKISVEGIKYFVENKANIQLLNHENNTAFHLYYKKNNQITSEILKAFLEVKCDFNMTNNSLITPFFYACKNKNFSLDILKIFFNEENKPNLNNSSPNDLPIENCQNSTSLGNCLHFLLTDGHVPMDKLKFMIKEKAEINEKDTLGNTPFHLACKAKNFSFEILKYFVENKADINSQNDDQITPLLIVSDSEYNKKNIEMIQYLIDNKADVNYSPNNLFVKRILKNYIILTKIGRTIGRVANPEEIINYFLKKKSN